MERSEIRGGVATSNLFPDYAVLHPGYACRHNTLLLSKHCFGDLSGAINQFVDLLFGRLGCFFVIAEISNVAQMLNKAPSWYIEHIPLPERVIQLANGWVLAYRNLVLFTDAREMSFQHDT